MTNKINSLQKWAGIPLLLSILTFGMPIGRPLEEAREIWVEELANITYEAAREVAAGEWIATAVPIALYLFSIYCIGRGGAVAAVKAWKIIWPVTIVPFLIALSALWSDAPERVFANAFHACGMLAVTAAATWRYQKDSQSLVKHVSLVLSIGCLIHLTAVLAIPHLASALDGRWRGLTTHPNTLGVVACLTVFFSAAAYFDDKNRKVSIAGIFLGITLIAGADSMTSALVVSVSCVWLYISTRLIRKDPRGDLIRRVALILFLLGVFLMPFIFSFFVENIAPAIGRSSDLSGRSDLWALGLDAFMSRPFLGWGFDSHITVMRVFALPHTHFHNGYIDLAVRGGLMALLLFVIFLTKWMLSLRGANTDHYSVSTSLLLAFCMQNITEVSTFDFRNIFWLLLVTVGTLAMLNKNELRSEFSQ